MVLVIVCRVEIFYILESEDFKSPDEGGSEELGPTSSDPQVRQNLEAQAMALLAEEKKQKKKRNTSRIGIVWFPCWVYCFNAYHGG